MTRDFTFDGRIRSVGHALRGVALMLHTQHNAWIHWAATVLVIVAGLALQIEAAGWLWIVLAIVAVWTAEALNTALELLADVASPEFHPLVKQAKDVAAGAVLIAAPGSVMVGLLILGPPLVELVWRPLKIQIRCLSRGQIAPKDGQESRPPCRKAWSTSIWKPLVELFHVSNTTIWCPLTTGTTKRTYPST